MAFYDVPAPAKLNLFLHVLGRRPDGYHLLQTVFRFIDLCDSLDFELRSDGRVVCENAAINDSRHDLVVRAARVLQQATGTSQGAQIVCRKRIPMGGGLGGGSSDAATALIALNRLWHTNLSRTELMQLALPLGADVPVFLFGQSAFAEGVGEALSPIDLPQRAYVVTQPFAHVSTATVFSAPELTRNSECVKMSVFTDWQKNSGNVGGPENLGVWQGRQGYPEGISGFGRNDLEPVARSMYPRVDQMASWLESCGYHARMTGSGACFFVELVTIDQAHACLGKITAKMPACGGTDVPVIKNSWVCKGLTDHPLRHWIRS